MVGPLFSILLIVLPSAILFGAAYLCLRRLRARHPLIGAIGFAAGADLGAFVTIVALAVAMRTGSSLASSLGHIAYSIAVAGGAMVGGVMAYAIVKAVLRK
jgi:predicted MFS family arabinose efflux permease